MTQTAEQHADAILRAAGSIPLDSSFYGFDERTAILAAVTAAMEDGQINSTAHALAYDVVCEQRDALAAEIARLRDRLQRIAYGDTSVDLSSGLSGGGVTICGDKASIKVVQRALHDSAQLEEFRTAFNDRKAGLEGRIATLRAHADELAGALEPFKREWDDMGMPDDIPGDSLMLDVDPGGEVLTVSHWRNLMAALAKHRESK